MYMISIIIITLIVITIIISSLIIQPKIQMMKRVFAHNESLDESVKPTTNFIDTTKNLREHYLEEYLNKRFYEKYSEKALEEEIEKANLETWTLNINNIDLLAEIAEGTEVEVLNQYVGHFDETKILNGNIGVAAHNRGYPVNYFENLDKLKIGDNIDYRINDLIKKYKVSSIQIIKETDWTYLEDTREDCITLITCVKNKPEYRLCVQAHKESEEILNNAEKNFSSRYGNNFIIKCDISRKC